MDGTLDGTSKAAVGANGLAVTANASTLPTATTMQNAATGTGNGTNLAVTGYAVAIMNIVSSPAMSGGTTITFEASVDDTTWVTMAGHQIGSNGSLVTTTTADGDFRFAVAGYKSLRARISTYSAGTITVKGYVSPIPSHPTAVAIATGTNTIGALTANQSVNVAQINGTTADTNSGSKSAGTQRVVIATDQPALTNPLLVSEVPTTTGGVSIYSFLSTAAVQSAQIKGSAGQAYGIHFFNNTATIAYVRLYNQTGAPASTDTANIVWRGMIPANTNATGFLVHMEGTAFSTGIGIRVTAAVADNDTTALAANAVMGNVLYK